MNLSIHPARMMRDIFRRTKKEAKEKPVEVMNTLKISIRHGEDTKVGDDDMLIVRSCWGRKDLVRLQIPKDNVDIAVKADELIAAVTNAQNTGER